MYTLYYTSANLHGTGWSVYSEQYRSIASHEPIDGSQRWIMTCESEEVADRHARRLQRGAYHRARLDAGLDPEPSVSRN